MGGTGKIGGQLDVGQHDVGLSRKDKRMLQPTAQSSRQRSIGHRSWCGIRTMHPPSPRFPT